MNGFSNNDSLCSNSVTGYCYDRPLEVLNMRNYGYFRKYFKSNRSSRHGLVNVV